MYYSSLDYGKNDHNSQDNSLVFTQKHLSDSIALFLREKLISDSHSSIRIGNKNSQEDFLYPQYLRYCQLNDIKPESLNYFSPKLMELCQKAGLQVERTRSNKGCSIVGLKLKTESDNQNNNLLLFPSTIKGYSEAQNISESRGQLSEDCRNNAKITVLDKVRCKLAPDKIGTVVKIELPGEMPPKRKPLVDVTVLFEDGKVDVFYLEQLELIDD